MRTTLEISDQIYRQLKREAVDQGVTVRQVIKNAVRAYLGKPKPRKSYQLQSRSERGRILPGVRLDNRESLFDLNGRPFVIALDMNILVYARREEALHLSAIHSV